MTLQFSKVKYMDGDSVLTGLINYSDCLQHNELPMTISCKSSCQIHLQDGNEYKVFWKSTKTLKELDENWEERSTSESEVSHISETTSSSSEKSVKSVTEYSTEEIGSSDDVEQYTHLPHFTLQSCWGSPFNKNTRPFGQSFDENERWRQFRYVKT